MFDVYSKAVELIDSGRSLALAVVLNTDGSTPQVTGARAIIEDNGKTWGTIGGGMVEAEAQRNAIEACESKCPLVIDIELKHAYSRDAAAICGGRMRILIDPTAAKDRESYARAAEARKRRERGVLITTVCEVGRVELPLDLGRGGPRPYPSDLPLDLGRGGPRPYPSDLPLDLGRGGPRPYPSATVQWISEDQVSEGRGFIDVEAVRGCLARESAQVFVKDVADSDVRTTVLVEPVIPNPVLLIAGGGHIGQALARAAVFLGFDVTVVDDRPEFTDPSLFPEGVSTRCGDFAKEVAAFPVAGDVFIVLVTPGHRQDAEALEACIHKPATYIGMIGSKRKVAMIRKNFIESGLATDSEFDRVYAPIGLDIGAITVPEIATSIAAQLVAVRRERSAQRIAP